MAKAVADVDGDNTGGFASDGSSVTGMPSYPQASLNSFDAPFKDSLTCTTAAQEAIHPWATSSYSLKPTVQAMISTTASIPSP